MWSPVDTHAEVGVDMPYEIVTVLDQTFDDRGAVDLVYLIMHVGRSRRAV